jgi:hypothetical protein
LRGKTSELLCMADGREVEFAERRRRIAEEVRGGM